jgi:hypothetical protein
MFYNIYMFVLSYIRCKGTTKNHIRKFFDKKKYYLQFTCIFRKKVVSLHAILQK